MPRVIPAGSPALEPLWLILPENFKTRNSKGGQSAAFVSMRGSLNEWMPRKTRKTAERGLRYFTLLSYGPQFNTYNAMMKNTHMPIIPMIPIGSSR
jgi:hypothetical protein